LCNPFRVEEAGFSAVPRVREARPWAVVFNPFVVNAERSKTKPLGFTEKSPLSPQLYDDFLTPSDCGAPEPGGNSSVSSFSFFFITTSGSAEAPSTGATTVTSG
jgi:hypothetical protein